MKLSMDPEIIHRTFLGTWNKEHFKEYSLEHGTWKIPWNNSWNILNIQLNIPGKIQ